MIPSPKRHKGIKFNKVEKKNFKHAKRLSLNKSPDKLNILNEYYSHSPQNKKKKRNSIKSNAINKLLKNIEDNYSITKKHSNKNFKKMHSSNKINTIKFKNLILSKKKGIIKDEEKNEEEDDDLPICLNLGNKNIQQKRYTSSNNIHHIFKSIINKDLINKNNNYNKKSKEFNTINIYKESNKPIKKKKKKKENKIEKKQSKEILENIQNKSQKENNLNINEIKDKEKNKKSINNIKSKFFCCL